MRLLHVFRLGAVTLKAGGDRIRLQETRRLPGVRVVANGAVAQRAWMLHLRLVHLFADITVAGKAQRPGVRVRENYLSVHWGLVAGIAHLVFERIVQIGLHQFGRPGLMRIVALNAVGAAEGLILVGLLQARVFGIVAIDAERWRRLCQVIIEFLFSTLAVLVGQVAGLASHVESGVTTPSLWDVHTFGVALETQVVVLGGASRRLQQLILIR